MQKSNYFVLKEFPLVQIFGFSHIGTTAYIRITQSNNTIIVECDEQQTNNRCFKVKLNRERIITSSQLYHIINFHKLENIHFIYNQFMNNYFSSNIRV